MTKYLLLLLTACGLQGEKTSCVISADCLGGYSCRSGQCTAFAATSDGGVVASGCASDPFGSYSVELSLLCEGGETRRSNVFISFSRSADGGVAMTNNGASPQAMQRTDCRLVGPSESPTIELNFSKDLAVFSGTDTRASVNVCFLRDGGEADHAPGHVLELRGTKT